MRHLSVFASFLFFLFVVTVLAAAEPEFSYYENVTTFVPKNFSCGRGVTVSTCAPDETAFNGDRIALQKLFLGLWVGSDFKYPKLERIVIVGKTGRPTVYQGVAGKSWNWLPKDEGIPPSLVVADTGGRDSVSRSKLPKSVKNDDSLPSDRNILGTWYGSYTCEHGSVNVTLELEEIKRLVKGENLIQNIKGELAFYPQFGSTDNRGGKAEIGGSASFPQRSLMLNQRSWIKDPGNHPPIYFFGYVSFDGQRIFGNLRIPHCSDLPLTREKPATPQPTVAEKAVAGEIGSIVGTWKGSYVCSGDSIGMMLSISRAGEAGLSATFNFYPLTLDDASGPSGIPKGSFGLRGNYDELTQAFELKPTGWIEKPVRSGMAMIGMSGLLDETGSRLTGSVLHSRCAGFEATRYTKTVKVEPEKAAQPIPTALADAKTTYERCEVLLRWAGKMAKEYPDIDLDHTVLGKLYQKAVNLYSDEHFIPVFGTAFDRLDNAARKDITEKQLQCTNNVKAGHPERDHYRFLLNPIVQSPFFDKGSFGYESVASLVAERRSLRIWRGRVINGVKGMSDTPENHEKLEEYLEKGEKDLVELWPSEQKSFKETMLSRRAGMAESILEALYKDRQLPMTLESVKLVEEKRARYANDLKQLPDERRADLEARLDEKTDAILAILVKQELEDFRGIPANRDIWDRVEEWNRGFSQKYDKYRQRLPVVQTLSVYGTERTKKLAMALETMRASLQKKARAVAATFEGARELKDEWQGMEKSVSAIDDDRRRDFQEIVVGRTDEIYASLASESEKVVNATGQGYADVSQVLEATVQAAERFEEADAGGEAARIYAAGVRRAEALLETSYPGFLEELVEIEPSPEAVEALRERAFNFREMMDVIEGFARYEEATWAASDKLQGKWCETVFKQAGFRTSDAKKPVASREGPVDLLTLVCNSSLNGYRLERVGGGLFSEALAMTVYEPSDQSARLEFGEDEATGNKVLVGLRLGDKGLSRDDWLSYAHSMLLPQLSGIPDRNGATDCDRLAGDPDDTGKVGDGVPSEELDLERGIEACVMAMEFQPESPRLQYQLGRLLFMAGEEDAAIELFELADVAGYGIASYKIGEALYLSEDTEEEYIDAARDYYVRAVNGGYAPGREKVAELEAVLATVKPPFDAGSFHRLELMKAAYEGDIDVLREYPGAGTYLARLVGAYSEICQNALPPGFRENLFRIIMENKLGKGEMDSRDAFAAGGLKMMMEIMASYANPGKMIMEEGAVESLLEDAATDIMAMNTYYECGSEKMEPLWQNVMKYFRSNSVK